jgi:predicted nucleic acid-binding protein
MTSWFLDASTIVAAEDDDDRQQAAARALLTSDSTLHTLDLAYYETADVAHRRWHDDARALRLRRIVDAIADADGLVRVDRSLSAEIGVLAGSRGLSAYDAAYVAGAASVGATFVSCDVRDLVGPGHAITPEQAVSGEG